MEAVSDLDKLRFHREEVTLEASGCLQQVRTNGSRESRSAAGALLPPAALLAWIRARRRMSRDT